MRGSRHQKSCAPVLFDAFGIGDNEVGKHGDRDDHHQDNEAEHGRLILLKPVPDFVPDGVLAFLSLSHGSFLLPGIWP